MFKKLLGIGIAASLLTFSVAHAQPVREYGYYDEWHYHHHHWHPHYEYHYEYQAPPPPPPPYTYYHYQYRNGFWFYWR